MLRSLLLFLSFSLMANDPFIRGEVEYWPKKLELNLEQLKHKLNNSFSEKERINVAYTLGHRIVERHFYTITELTIDQVRLIVEVLAARPIETYANTVEVGVIINRSVRLLNVRGDFESVVSSLKSLALIENNIPTINSYIEQVKAMHFRSNTFVEYQYKMEKNGFVSHLKDYKKLQETLLKLLTELDYLLSSTQQFSKDTLKMIDQVQYNVIDTLVLQLLKGVNTKEITPRLLEYILKTSKNNRDLQDKFVTVFYRRVAWPLIYHMNTVFIDYSFMKTLRPTWPAAQIQIQRTVINNDILWKRLSVFGSIYMNNLKRTLSYKSGTSEFLYQISENEYVKGFEDPDPLRVNRIVKFSSDVITTYGLTRTSLCEAKLKNSNN